jgi:RND family efflux transporter MFP subunit
MMSSKIRKIGLPLAVIFGGLVIAVLLMTAGPDAEPFVPERAVPTVRVQAVEAGAVRAIVAVTGVTSPAREVTIIPQVSGRVVWLSESVVPGGRVRAGDELMRIEAADYELAVEQQRGQVRSAELELELAEAQQETAREEWKILGNGGEPSPLVLRESQRAAAEMNLISSRSALARAELDLERTMIRAPFNASVVEESVDVGQVVGAQSTVARLVGTDQLRVTLSVRVEDLALIELPAEGELGSSVAVRQRLRTGEQVERSGRVVGLVDRLDPQTRRAELLVLIDDPFGSGEALPLLPGASVDAEIQGLLMESMVRVPRGAVHDGGSVWLVSPDQELERRALSPVWGDDDALYVRDGLAPGEWIVTSPLSAPVEGTRVEVLGGDS